mmetsp:Transcript_71238/g.170595  ORF Transcript_71238/g.170595 Transcript_71238/m.170595 type:complete len:1221 (-) Transcript_71238:62-3724(-)
MLPHASEPSSSSSGGAAGSQQAQDTVLRVLLEQAKPSWSEKTLINVMQRLEQVGITTAEDFRLSLGSGDLNKRMRKKELKTFTSDTLDEFRRHLGVGEKPKEVKLENSEATADCGDAVLPQSQLQLASVTDKAPTLRDAGARGTTGALAKVNRRAAGPAASPPTSAFADFGQSRRVSRDQQPQPVPAALADAPRPPPLAGDALVDAALHFGIDVSKLEIEKQDDLSNLVTEVRRVEGMTAEKLREFVSSQWGMPVENFAERSVLKNIAKDFLVWKVMKMHFLRDVCVDKIGVNVGDDLSREQLVQLIKNASWEERGIPVTRLQSLEDAQWIFDEVDNLGFITQPQELVDKCRRYGVSAGNLPERGIEAYLKKKLRQAFIWSRMSVEALRRECRVHGVSLESGQTASSKAASEAFVLREALLKWLSEKESLDRGVPRHRFVDEDAVSFVVQEVERFQVVSDLHLLAECRHRDVPIPPGDESHVLVHRLRQDFIWQNLPEQELRKDCDREGVTIHPGTTRSAMVTALNDRQRLRDELEERGIHASKYASMDDVLQVVELHRKVDEMEADELREWYDSLGYPVEADLPLDDIVALYKGVCNWDTMLTSELLKEAQAKYCIIDEELAMDDSPQEQRSALVNKLMGVKRLEIWDAHGFQASRVGDVVMACKLVDQFEIFQAMGDAELEAAYAQSGLIVEDGMSRDEMLQMLKTLLIWETLPIEDLEAECSERGVPIELSALEPNEDIRSAVFNRLAALERMPAWEAAGFQANRVGDPLAVSRVVACHEQCKKMGEAELKEQYTSAGLHMEKDMSREAMLTILKSLLLWQEMPHSELTSESLQKHLPMPSASSREEVLQLLVMDKIATECRFCYDQRGIPFSRLSSAWVAYELARRFDQIEAMSLAELRDAHAASHLEYEATMSRTELRQRLLDVSVWQELALEELRLEAKKEELISPMDEFTLSRMHEDEERQYLLGLLCGQTYDTAKQWKQHVQMLAIEEKGSDDPAEKPVEAPAAEKAANPEVVDVSEGSFEEPSKQQVQTQARLPSFLMSEASSSSQAFVSRETDGSLGADSCKATTPMCSSDCSEGFRRSAVPEDSHAGSREGCEFNRQSSPGHEDGDGEDVGLLGGLLQTLHQRDELEEESECHHLGDGAEADSTRDGTLDHDTAVAESSTNSNQEETLSEDADLGSRLDFETQVERPPSILEMPETQALAIIPALHDMD